MLSSNKSLAWILALTLVAPSALAQAAPPMPPSPTPSPERALPPAIAREITIAASHGSVEVIDPGASSTPRPARAGEALPAGARIQTGDDGSTQLALPNGATLTLLPGARLVAPGASTSQPGVGAPFATLEAGAVRVASPASCGQTFPLVAGSTTIQLGCGDGVVSLALGGRVTRISAHRGRLRARSSEGALVVRAGHGVSLESGRRSHTHSLPLAPRWVQPPSERVTTAGNPVDVAGTFTAGKHVARWRVERALDPSFRDVVAVARVDNAAPRWEGRGLATGSYFVRVWALDRDLYEGPPSAAARVEVQGPVLEAGAAPHDGARGRLATVRAPAGVACGLDGAPLEGRERPMRLTPALEHRVRCAMSAGSADAYELVVPASGAGPVLHQVQVRVTNMGEGLLRVRLVDAEGYTLPYANLAVTASAGVTVDPLRETEDRGMYRAAIFWSGPNPPPMSLRFTLNNAISFEERFEHPGDVEASTAPR